MVVPDQIATLSQGEACYLCNPCRYFLHIWPELAFLAYDSGHCLGTVVCKMDRHKCTNMMRGYLAMLVVEKPYRALGVGEQGCLDGLWVLLRETCAAALAQRTLQGCCVGESWCCASGLAASCASRWWEESAGIWA